MAGPGKPSFLAAMAALKGKVVRGLAPTGNGPSKQQKPGKKKIFGRKDMTNRIAGKKLPDIQNMT